MVFIANRSGQTAILQHSLCYELCLPDLTYKGMGNVDIEKLQVNKKTSRAAVFKSYFVFLQGYFSSGGALL